MIIAIDPGKGGGCVLASRAEIKTISFKSRHLNNLALELEALPIQHAYIERVYGTATLTHAKQFEFGRNVGQWEGLLASLGSPITYVPPRTWQFPLKIYERTYNKRKSALFKLAKQRFSHLGSVTRATCDAWLILEWALNNDPACKALASILKPCPAPPSGP